MIVLEFLRNLMGTDVTLLFIQAVTIVLLGVVIALVFFTVRGLVMYIYEQREKSNIRKGR